MLILRLVVCAPQCSAPALPLHAAHSPLAPLLCSLYLWVYFYSVTFTHFVDSTWKWKHTVSVFVWLISLTIISSRAIHIVANCKFSFFLQLSNIPFCAYVLCLLYPCLCQEKTSFKKRLSGFLGLYVGSSLDNLTLAHLLWSINTHNEQGRKC